MAPLQRMTVSPGFRSFVLDQLEGVGNITARSMFGGVGLYCDAVFFGIIAADVLYLKVDDTTRNVYESAGMRPFRPYADRAGTMQYYAVPIGVLESGEIVDWAKAAVRVGNTKGTKRTKRTKHTKPTKDTKGAKGSKRPKRPK